MPNQISCYYMEIRTYLHKLAIFKNQSKSQIFQRLPELLFSARSIYKKAGEALGTRLELVSLATSRLVPEIQKDGNWEKLQNKRKRKEEKLLRSCPANWEWYLHSTCFCNKWWHGKRMWEILQTIGRDDRWKTQSKDSNSNKKYKNTYMFLVTEIYDSLCTRIEKLS